MGLAGVPENSNSISPVLDNADSTYSPVRNSDTISKSKSPRHFSLVSVFSQRLRGKNYSTAELAGQGRKEDALGIKISFLPAAAR